MSIDLTNFTGAITPNTPQVKRVIKPMTQASNENLTVPQSEAAKEHRKNHWTIDKFEEDGQLEAGVPDEAYAQHLKNTEFKP